jgi:hypothetical protein
MKERTYPVIVKGDDTFVYFRERKPDRSYGYSRVNATGDGRPLGPTISCMAPWFFDDENRWHAT